MANRTYTPEELENIKAMFMTSRYVRVAMFMRKFYPEFHQHMMEVKANDVYPLSVWEDEKEAMLATKQIAAQNLTHSYKENVKDRFDLLSHLQDKLVNVAIENNLSVKEIQQIVDTMDTLSKIQDRTATIANAVAVASSGKAEGYEEQKRRVDLLFNVALKEAGIDTQQKTDELVADNADS